MVSVVKDGRGGHTYLILLNYLLDLPGVINVTKVKPIVKEYTSDINSILNILITIILENSLGHIYTFYDLSQNHKSFAFIAI